MARPAMNPPRPNSAALPLLRLSALAVLLGLSISVDARQQPPAPPPAAAKPAPEAAVTTQPTPEVSTKDAVPTFTSRVNLVPVSVVVRDDKGRAIGNLTKDDFQLTDNGKPQLITKFSIEKSDAPVVVQKETPDV
jgi:Ca-activated chloride channel family protein